jgi:hypothetical protein
VPDLQTYIERLRSNPDWQSFVGALEADAVSRLDQLVYLPAQSAPEKIEALRGEIRALFTVLDKPQVYQAQLSKRRERMTNG